MAEICDPYLPHLFEDELHAVLQLVLGVDLQLVELADQDVELLRAQLVQDAASLAQENFLEENIRPILN
jgi:hypothetical protein